MLWVSTFMGIKVANSNTDLYGTTLQLRRQYNSTTGKREREPGLLGTLDIAQNNASDWYHLSVIIFY